MSRMKIIYTMELHMSSGEVRKIKVATFDKTKIPDLIEKNKMFLQMPRMSTDGKMFEASKIQRFTIVDEVLPFNLDQHIYYSMLSECDIEEELEEDIVVRDRSPHNESPNMVGSNLLS